MSLRASAIIALALVLAACQGTPSAPPAGGGAVVFVDAAGNRMRVDVGGDTPADTARIESAEALSPAAPALPTADPAAAAAQDAITFGGEQFIDADDFEQAADSREGQRFYQVPDGSGARQTLTRADLGMAEPAAPVVADAAVPALVLSCGNPQRFALHPLTVRAHHDLSFPVVFRRQRYAGYRLAVPPGTTGVALWAWVRRGVRPGALLALLDARGAVTGIVNNIPTESIPETMFRYGRVGGEVGLPSALRAAAGAGQDAVNIAVLDGPMVASRLPPACRPAGSERVDISSEGLVSLEFTGSTGN